MGQLRWDCILPTNQHETVIDVGMYESNPVRHWVLGQGIMLTYLVKFAAERTYHEYVEACK